MNNDRRKELRNAVALMAEAFNIVENIKQEEEESFDNLPESLQEGERGDMMQQYISVMDDVIVLMEESMQRIEDEVIDA